MDKQSVADFLVRLKRNQLRRWISPYLSQVQTPTERAFNLNHVLSRENPTFFKIMKQSQYYCNGTYSALFKLLGYQ